MDNLFSNYLTFPFFYDIILIKKERRYRGVVTEFGKIIRIFRMEHGLLLKDMADQLGYPPSFLSAIEMGRKSIPDGFLEKFFDTYNVPVSDRETFREAAKNSVASVKLDLQGSNNERRKLAITFARRFEDLDEKQIAEIQKLLHK